MIASVFLRAPPLVPDVVVARTSDGRRGAGDADHEEEGDGLEDDEGDLRGQGHRQQMSREMR